MSVSLTELFLFSFHRENGIYFLHEALFKTFIAIPKVRIQTQDPNNEMTNIHTRAPAPIAPRNQWAFPKVTAKKPKLFSKNPALTSNRCTCLQVDEENSECVTFPARNVVPGDASYSESVRGKNRRDKNMRSDSFAWPNENEVSNERADENVGFGQDG